MHPCRLYIDPPANGAWNMAVDEALLQQAAAKGEASLRFYQWIEPTLSLGYFQAYAERQAHAPSHAATVVRRLSGGGALVHDRELTYALCLPPGHPLVRQPASVYAIVHRGLVDSLQYLGVEARFHGDGKPSGDAQEEQFLCFARRTGYDIVMDSKLSKRTSEISQAKAAPSKIAGSAQRRSRGALLQHGGVLLGRSPEAPELPGIVELSGISIAPERLVAAWISRLAAGLGLELSAAETTVGAELEGVSRLAEKYADPIWTKRR